MSETNPLTFPTWQNLVSKTAMFTENPWDWDPTEEQVEGARALPKKKRKEWMALSDTNWNVYAAIKGQNWYHPVSTANPPHAILALVIDYDVPMERDWVIDTCNQWRELGRQCPQYIEVSLSGNYRCIWPFESQILVADKRFCEEFLRQLGALLNINEFLIGADRKTFDAEMRWTNGGEWLELGSATPLSIELLTGVAVKTATKQSETVANVPLDEIAPLLDQKYPRFKDFNGGELKLQAIGIRFWEEGSDNQNAAMVLDKGLYCVTGDTAFKTWEDLLGKQVVETLRATSLGTVSSGIYHDSRRYYRKTSKGYKDCDKADVLMHLASRGISRTKQKGENLSAGEEVLIYIQNEHDIEGAAPLLFRPEGVVHYQNRSVLNISRCTPLPASEEICEDPAVGAPWLWNFYNKFFVPSDGDPLNHFLAWWQRFYLGAINHKPLGGQSIFICGPQGCGKNFISELIIPMSMGGSASNPYRYLMGDTTFSDDVFSSAVLAINDEDAPPEFKKSTFEQKIKSLVANNEHSYHPKFMKSIRIEWSGRLIVTLNEGPKDVGILPMINPNTSHKMSFYRAQNHDHEFFDVHTNRRRVKEELPHLLSWLKNIYKPPASIMMGADRIGVKSFHDPYLVKINRQEQLSYNLLELLSAWMHNEHWNVDCKTGNKDIWNGTPTNLLQALTRDHTLEHLVKDWKPNAISKALGDLARAQTPGVLAENTKKGRNYSLSRSDIVSMVSETPVTAELEPFQMELNE